MTVLRMTGVAALAGGLLALAACSAGSTQDRPSSSATTKPGKASAFTSPSPSTKSVRPVGFGAAQPAVDAYLRLVEASNAAFRNPRRISAAQIDKLTAGQAKISFDQSLASARRQGIAYRGTPSTPRLTVTSSKLDGTLPSVVLRDCGLVSKGDPFVGYRVSTGRAVPTTAATVLPPYAKTIKLFQPNRKAWIVTSLTTDATKTCKP